MKACKDKQSTLNGQTSASLVNIKNEVCGTYKVPTFRPQGNNQKLDLDVKTLTKSNGATALCVTDPFAYYSCFTPSGSLSSKVANLAKADKQDEDGSGQTVIISVTRKTHVSTECDGLTHLLHSLQEITSVQVDDEDDSECDDFSLALYSMLGMNLEDDSQDGGIDSIY